MASDDMLPSLMVVLESGKYADSGVRNPFERSRPQVTPTKLHLEYKTALSLLDNQKILESSLDILAKHASPRKDAK